MIEFYIPREAVVDCPKIVCPIIGRAKELDLWYINGTELTNQQFNALSPSKYPHNWREMRMLDVEIWEDEGDDGHVDYRLDATRKMTEKAFYEYLGEKGFQKME